MNQMQRFQLRFLWYVSRTALSGPDSDSRYKRMIWASDAFHTAYPDISATAAYKELQGMLAWGR